MSSLPSVLIVEDSYVVLEMLRTLFERQGARVYEASSGEAALTILRQPGLDIDWLLTDIALPGFINGWEVAAAFRAIYPQRPVIYASASEPVGGRPVPDSLYVRKPFKIREMSELARMLVADSASRRGLAA